VDRLHELGAPAAASMLPLVSSTKVEAIGRRNSLR
jgi:hypothetical protein